MNDWSYTGAEGVGLPFVIFDKTSGTAGSPTPVIYTASDSIANTATKLYRTTDGGATWTPMLNQPTTTNFPLRAALSADGTVMYVTYGKQAGPLCSSDGDSVIYKITNPSSANPTWTVVGTSMTIVGSNSGIFGPIAIDPTDNNTIYTVTMNSWPSNIFRSTNGGSTWTALNPNNAANRDNSLCPRCRRRHSELDHGSGDRSVQSQRGHVQLRRRHLAHHQSHRHDPHLDVLR